METPKTTLRSSPRRSEFFFFPATTVMGFHLMAGAAKHAAAWSPTAEAAEMKTNKHIPKQAQPQTKHHQTQISPAALFASPVVINIYKPPSRPSPSLPGWQRSLGPLWRNRKMKGALLDQGEAEENATSLP